MCGIAALILPRPAELVAPLRAMTTAMRARGPDDEGLWLDGLRLGGPDTPAAAYAADVPWAPVEAEPPAAAAIGLGHRRLAVLDPTPAGHQPMTDAAGRALVYNGEVYNYRELRGELEATGHVFQTQTDTEVLLAAWDRWGAGCLERFVGMFAFVLVDPVAGEVVAARDPFGIKPLYHASWRGGLALASTIGALRGLPGASQDVDPQRLLEYLRHGWTDWGSRTLLAAVRAVPRGHLLRAPLRDPGAARLERWAPVEPDADPAPISLDQAAGQVREAFLRSVDLHLRSDVRVGAALSGGIDSSAIVGAIRHLRPELELHTFSYVADDPRVSEERWASQAAEHAGAVRHLIRIEPRELVEDLDRMIEIQDLPVGSTSMYAQYRVFRRAREEGVTVMLDGQGADELLAGYVRDFLPARLASLLRARKLRRAARLLRAIQGVPGITPQDALTRAGALFVPRAAEDRLRRAVGRDLWPDWLERSWFEARGAAPLRERPRPPHYLRDALRRARAQTNLPMLLRFEDRNSMAWSVESRVPFLTPELLTILDGLPEHLLLDDDALSKAVFRKALRGIVPDAILDRTDKVGFATPEQEWLEALTPWVAGVLESEAARAIPALRADVLQGTWREVLARDGRFDYRVWRWVNLVRWAEVTGATFA